MQNCAGVEGREPKSSVPGHTDTWVMAVSALRATAIFKNYQVAGLLRAGCERLQLACC